MKKGDIVKIEYDMWTEVDGVLKLRETTSQEHAKKEGIYNENMTFHPLYTILGENRIPTGFDNSLLNAEVEKEYEIRVEPAEGFGEEKAELIETIPLKEFRKKKLRPKVGMVVSVGNREGQIIRITESRAFIDFNHPLAGKTLKYRHRILSKARNTKEKAQWVLASDYDHFGIELPEVKIENNNIEVKLIDRCKTDPEWTFAKYRAVSDLRKFAGVKIVRFVEEYPFVEKKEKVEEETKEKTKKR
jgi:FKBP-type peptidyl-prolyl cis-trans isomerase 2